VRKKNTYFDGDGTMKRCLRSLDKAKAFAGEHVPDPNGRWYQPHAGEWYRSSGRDDRLYAVPQIERRKVTRKTPLAGQLQLYLF